MLTLKCFANNFAILHPPTFKSEISLQQQATYSQSNFTTYKYDNYNHFTDLWIMSGQPGWAGTVVPEGTFRHLLDFWCKMKITQADTPTIRMDCHPIQANWCPHLCHPHHFYARCPSWYNPPNLSWLGTGTKYAGLHTRWLGHQSSLICFLHLLRFMASSLFNLHAWQSFSTISLHVFFEKYYYYYYYYYIHLTAFFPGQLRWDGTRKAELFW